MSIAGPTAAGGTTLQAPRTCSFEPHDWQILARFWYPVARSADLVPGTPAAATLLDERLVLYRTPDGRPVVARDLCIHRGVPLSMGWVEGEELVCRYHGLRYGPDGACRAIPADPGGTIPSRLRIATFPAIERFGLVWTSLDPEADPALMPSFPLWDEPGFQQIVPPWIDIAGSAGRQCEGFIDVAHFAWVHDQTFADRANPVVPSYQVGWHGRVLTADYISDVPNFPHGLGLTAPEGFLWRRYFEIELPFSPRLTIFFPGGKRLSIFNAASPISARRTRLFVPIVRDFDTDGPPEPVYEFNRRIFEEDRAIVENQHPEDLPLDLMAEAHIAADRSSIAYRRGLAALGLGRHFTS
jgi:phenylpropionate dioxygenase-like ring-hydroxylating dioxygenase large terminal subunit